MRVALLEERVSSILQEINGGPGLKREDSIRGRIHLLLNRMTAEDALVQAANDLRRARRQTSAGRLALYGVFIAVFASLPGWIALVVAYWP